MGAGKGTRGDPVPLTGEAGQEAEASPERTQLWVGLSSLEKAAKGQAAAVAPAAVAPEPLRLRGGGGEAPKTRSIRMASLNVGDAGLTDTRWERIVAVLRDLDVALCALQSHKMAGAWAHLDQGEYTLVLDKCACGPNGGPAGGVGWAVRQDVAARVVEAATSLGKMGKAITLDGALELVSVYLQPGAMHDAATTQLFGRSTGCFR